MKGYFVLVARGHEILMVFLKRVYSHPFATFSLGSRYHDFPTLVLTYPKRTSSVIDLFICKICPAVVRWLYNTYLEYIKAISSIVVRMLRSVWIDTIIVLTVKHTGFP